MIKLACLILLAAAQLQPPQVPANLLSACVRVEHHLPDGTIETGSGTVVSRQGRRVSVLTCQHVMESPGGCFYVVYTDGTCARANVTSCDPYADLGLLETQAPAYVQPVSVANIPPRLGDSCLQIGYPGGCGQPVPRQGTFFARARVDDGKRAGCDVARCSMTSEPGCSGCGIFQDGKLIAVVWGGLPGESYATPLQEIRDFLDRKTVAPSLKR